MNILTEITTDLKDLKSLFDVEQVMIRRIREVFQLIMSQYLEQLDNALAQNCADPVINLQQREITFAFGKVTFKRRYYLGENGGYFLLDRSLKIDKYKRFSPYLKQLMAKIGQLTTMRNTAQVINVAYQSDISADAVMKAIHELGAKVAEKAVDSEKQIVHRLTPHNLVIEGDDFNLRSQKPGEQFLVHHYRVYEKAHGQLINCHDFVGLNRLEVRNRVTNYLDRRYRLTNQTIFLNSDGGPGYDPQSMKDLVPSRSNFEYVIDRYHCLQKLITTIGRQNPLVNKAVKALRKYDRTRLQVVLDTYESQITDPQSLQQLDHLYRYLARNWQYIKHPSDRGYPEVGHLGSIESAHRILTYRMKKQGRCWTNSGVKAMIGLLEARMNSQLDNILTIVSREISQLPQNLSNQWFDPQVNIRQYFKHVPTRPSQGYLQGTIPVNGPSSSPIAHLAKLYR